MLIIESPIIAIVFFWGLLFLFLCSDCQIVFMVPLSLLSCLLKVLAGETIALSLYMKGTVIFSYLLMIFDLIAKNSKKCFSLISLRSKIYLEIKFGIKDRGRVRGLKN